MKIFNMSVSCFILFLFVCFASNSLKMPTRPPPNDYLVKQFHLDVGKYLLPAKEKISLESWTNPSIEDYKIIQDYLSNAPRPELQYCNHLPGSNWREVRIRNFKIIAENQNPEFHIELFGNDPNDKKNCIVTYISCNEGYKKDLQDLIHQLEIIGFNGHLIYRIGGWPNTEENSLELFDVPYAFKLFSILEARRLGYKNCLWLDACFYPVKPLDLLFEHIDKHGVFFCRMHDYNSTGHIQEFATLALANTPLLKFLKLNAVTTIAIGLDLTSTKGNDILFKWHTMAKNKLGFLSFIPEMAPWYILANYLDLLPYADTNFYVSCGQGGDPSTYLLYWHHR